MLPSATHACCLNGKNSGKTSFHTAAKTSRNFWLHSQCSSARARRCTSSLEMLRERQPLKTFGLSLTLGFRRLVHAFKSTSFWISLVDFPQAGRCLCHAVSSAAQSEGARWESRRTSLLTLLLSSGPRGVSWPYNLDIAGLDVHEPPPEAPRVDARRDLSSDHDRPWDHEYACLTPPGASFDDTNLTTRRHTPGMTRR